MPRIHGAILDALGAHSGVPRRARARAALLRQQRGRLEAALGHIASRGELEAALGREPAAFLQQAAVQLHGPLSLDAILDDPEQCDWDALASPHAEDDVTARIEQEEEAAELWRAITALSQREQDILRMVYAEEQPISVIAGWLGISQGRVSQLRDRAVQRLRTLIERRGAALLETDDEPALRPRRTRDLQVA